MAVVDCIIYRRMSESFPKYIKKEHYPVAPYPQPHKNFMLSK